MTELQNPTSGAPSPPAPSGALPSWQQGGKYANVAHALKNRRGGRAETPLEVIRRMRGRTGQSGDGAVVVHPFHVIAAEINRRLERAGSALTVTHESVRQWDRQDRQDEGDAAPDGNSPGAIPPATFTAPE